MMVGRIMGKQEQTITHPWPSYRLMILPNRILPPKNPPRCGVDLQRVAGRNCGPDYINSGRGAGIL